MRNLSVICVTFFFCAISMAITGCQDVHIEPENRPAMQLKLDEPYELQFGRGSGMAGLDTVVIKPSGQVIVHRRADQLLNGEPFWGWEMATFHITDQTRRRILQLIDEHDLLGLEKSYTNQDIIDGVQWAFWLTRGDAEKTISFSNHFPSAIKGFAEVFDAELQAAGMESATWTPLGPNYKHKHDDALWAAT